jgi:acyl carrier protein
LRKTLVETSDPAERLRLLEDWLREKVGRALGIAPQRLNPEKPLTEIGLDSLIAVELVTVLKMEIGFDLPAVKLLQGLNIRGLAALIFETILPVEQLNGSAPAAAPAAPPPPAEAPAPAAVKRNGTAPMEVAQSVPAQLVSNGAAAPNGVARRFDYAALDYQRLSETQRVARAVARAIFAAGSR